MNSYEVIKKSVSDLGVKSVASDLSVSSSLVYKWCQPNDSPDASGTDNPLDRLLKIYELTGDIGPITWLCEQANGYFVSNALLQEEEALPLLQMTRRIVREFSGLLDVLSESIENDGKIDLPESENIRRKWEELKRTSESFVAACERGVYSA